MTKLEPGTDNDGLACDDSSFLRIRHLRGFSIRNLDLNTLLRHTSTSSQQHGDDCSSPRPATSSSRSASSYEKNKFHETFNCLRGRQDEQDEQDEQSGQVEASRGHGVYNDHARTPPSSSTGRAISESPGPSPNHARPEINQAASDLSRHLSPLGLLEHESQASTWFSLHDSERSHPLYISEILSNMSNLDFAHFDLSTLGSVICRQQGILLKIWLKMTRTTQTTECGGEQHQVSRLIDMRDLIFLGEDFEDLDRHFAPNTILIHTSVGIHMAASSAGSLEPSRRYSRISRDTKNAVPSSTFNQLKQLANLDACIQDALKVRLEVVSRIERLIGNETGNGKENRDGNKKGSGEENGNQQYGRSKISQAHVAKVEQQLESTRNYNAIMKRQIRSARERIEYMQSDMLRRRARMKSVAIGLDRLRDTLAQDRKEVELISRRRSEDKEQIVAQQRRLGEDLGTIYPINPASPDSWNFTIRGYRLTKTDSYHRRSLNRYALHGDEQNSSCSAFALGCAAHLTQLLASYLNVPLPFPIMIRGSNTTIYDPISISDTFMSDAARTFPLFQNGAAEYRFEYAVFLLNSDIEQLMARQGARAHDAAHTGGNLKYLLTVMTDGTGQDEVPQRKRGRLKLLKASSGSNMDRDSVSTSGESSYGSRVEFEKVFGRR